MLLVSLVLAWPASAESWAADPRTGCRVSSETRPTGEVPIWEGACVDGVAQGTGRLAWIVRNRPVFIYEGTLERGRMHGDGAYELPNGQRYEGQFADDLPSGTGVYTWPSGSRYEGGFRNGQFHGRGIRTWGGDSPFAGDRYDGDFVEGRRTGKGLYLFANGQRYEGDFVDGKIDREEHTSELQSH